MTHKRESKLFSETTDSLHEQNRFLYKLYPHRYLENQFSHCSSYKKKKYTLARWIVNQFEADQQLKGISTHTWRKHSPVPIHLQFDMSTAGTSHLYFPFFFDRLSTSSFDNLYPKCSLKELHDESYIQSIRMTSSQKN